MKTALLLATLALAACSTTPKLPPLRTVDHLDLQRFMKAVARVLSTNTNAEWRVQFLWPFEAPFLVIDLSPDYRFTTIGYPNRDLIWIMSRSPEMSESDYARALESAKVQGYDISRIVKVPQTAGKKP